MKDTSKLVFKKENYMIMFLAIAVIIAGLTLMALDNEEFGWGVLGWYVGPVVTLIGFLIPFIAILYKPKQRKQAEK